MEMADFIIGAVIGFILGAIFGGILGIGITGNATSNCNCEFVYKNASYQLLSDKCEGEKGWVFGTDKCTIQLKNTEQEQSASYIVDFDCATINTRLTKTSNKVTLAPGQVGDLSIQFKEAEDKDWKCSVTNVISSSVNGCVAK